MAAIAVKQTYRDENDRLKRINADLLAALQDVLIMAEEYLKLAPSHPGNAILEDARAAIAKATGE